MEKVFLVESEFVEDCEKTRNERRAFKDETKARNFFNDEKRAYERIALGRDWEHEKSENSVEYFENGYYSHNHAVVTFTELEVEQ